MKTHVRIVVAALFLFGCSSAGVTFAQTNATQTFSVVVPSSISITAPANVSITHDLSDNNQVFPAQVWAIKGNSSRGVSVTFAANSPFSYTDANSTLWQRDANLGLTLGATSGPAAWVITKSSGVTNYAIGTNTATVQAASNGVGKANFNLNVTFVTNTFGSFAAGTYTTTVTGTVTQN